MCKFSNLEIGTQVILDREICCYDCGNYLDVIHIPMWYKGHKTLDNLRFDWFEIAPTFCYNCEILIGDVALVCEDNTCLEIPLRIELPIGLIKERKENV